MKQKELSSWLKGVIIMTGILGIVLLALIIPELGKEAVSSNPELSYMFWPCLLFVCLTAVPVYIALIKAWLLSVEISKDNSFCTANAARLKHISRLALLDSLLYILGTTALSLKKIMSPGLFLLLLTIVFIGIVITVVIAVISHLVEKAAALKQESDLTI